MTMFPSLLASMKEVNFMSWLHFLISLYKAMLLQRILEEKLKYAIHFCKSIDTDDYARIDLQDGEFDDEVASDVILSMTSRAGYAAQQRRQHVMDLLVGLDDTDGR